MPIKQSLPRILFLEPYYGGSHRAFLKGLQRHLSGDFSRLTLPARKWKMRMQLAAPWMAEKAIELLQGGRSFDLIFCSSMLDVATFRALLNRAGFDLPLGLYFHENQFAYPSQVDDRLSHQFTALNFTSALAADGIAFNSEYNRETFLDGVARYLGKAADMEITHLVETLRAKSTILYPGLDYRLIDRIRTPADFAVPVFVWNHRWEHDKDPETFFHALFDLAGTGFDFRLIVLGQSFARCPAIFSRVREKLNRHILYFGYARKREEYINRLCRGNIVVSTARHEFFGMAVLEAVRCGCRPVVPDGLAYRELFPKEYRYRQGGLKNALLRAAHSPAPLDVAEVDTMTCRYAWDRLAGEYARWFSLLLRRD
jgi:glycosyltransferase involved in cell wall biosynthesis